MQRQILYLGPAKIFELITTSIKATPEQELHRLKTLEPELPSYINKSLYTILIIDITTATQKQLVYLKEIEQNHPYLCIILLTNRAEVTEATEAMKTWANDYIIKPFMPEEIQVVIQRNIQRQGTFIENLQLKSQIIPDGRFKEIVTDDPKMKEIFKIIQLVAQSDTPVLIEGETGTGKELIARAIHRESPRHASGKFVAINSGALPESLLESELFGHEKGAFTGAVKRHIGKLEAAHNGTLFLDEIGNISHAMQVKLLRVLQEKEFDRVGGSKTIQANARIIAASNKDLSQLVRQGIIREDFYYRINVMQIKLPPLRERRADIPILALHFLRKYREAMHKDIKTISQGAMDTLVNYTWSGNIRELANVIERAVIMTDGPALGIGELSTTASNSDNGLNLPINENVPLKTLLDDINKSVEKEYLTKSLMACKGRLKQCAQKSGLSTRSIYSKMKEYGLDKNTFKIEK